MIEYARARMNNIFWSRTEDLEKLDESISQWADRTGWGGMKLKRMSMKTWWNNITHSYRSVKKEMIMDQTMHSTMKLNKSLCHKTVWVWKRVTGGAWFFRRLRTIQCRWMSVVNSWFIQTVPRETFAYTRSQRGLFWLWLDLWRFSFGCLEGSLSERTSVVDECPYGASISEAWKEPWDWNALWNSERCRVWLVGSR